MLKKLVCRAGNDPITYELFPMKAVVLTNPPHT
jgi:hypothetical protein